MVVGASGGGAPAVAVDAGAQPVSDVGAGVGYATVEATAEELELLEADPRVGSVMRRGTTVGLAMSESVPLTGAPSRWSAGYRGAGKVVVVIDTGVDARFGGTLVGGACFAATEVSFGTFEGHCGEDGDELRAYDGLCFELGVCDSGDLYDPAAGRPCAGVSGTPGRDCLHGTAVSAIAARGEPTPGMAPEAGVYGIRVFDPTGTSADLVDVYAALEHVLELHRAGLDVASVNLSVATTALFSGACDSSQALNGAIAAFRFMVGELAARGVPVVVASGNDGRPDQMAFPACLSTTVSVGATDLDDEMAPFSNRGVGLDVLAPGIREISPSRIPLQVPSAPGAPQDWAGTSFAAPHVAGALALVDQEYPSASVDQRVWLLRTGGVPVLSGGSTFRRMGLRSAAQVLNGGLLFPGTATVAGTSRSTMADFDGDGRADVLAHAPGPAPDRVSYGRAGWGFDARDQQVAGTYTPITGQFRGAADGPDDILWYAPGPAGDSVWEGRTGRTFTSSPVKVTGTYRPLVGDFDGDGWDDVFWYAPGPAGDSIWYGGAAGFTPLPIGVAGSYRTAVGDFDGDGRDDIVFHGPGAITDSLWRGTGTRGAFARSGLSLGGSALPFALDADGDGIDDLMLYEPGPAPDPLLLGGPDGFSTVAQSVRGTYMPLVGDFDGNGRDDIVWYAPGPAGDSIWLATSGGRFSGRTISVGGTYQPLVGDVDGSGSDDLVWFSPTSAATPVWWSYTP